MKKIGLILIMLMLFFNSCKDDSGGANPIGPPPPPPPPPPTGGIVYQDDAKVLSSETGNKISSVNSNSITFSETNDQISKLKVGEYILAGISSNAPKGLLRRITALKKVSGTKAGITMYTGPASLAEVIKSGEININKRIFSYSKTQKIVLLDLDNNYSTINDQTSATGTFSTSGDLTGKLSFGDNLSFNLNLKISGNLNLELISKIQNSFNKEYSLFKKNLPPIVVFPSPPIVITPKVEVYIRVEGELDGNFKTGFNDNLNLSFNASYNKGLSFSKNFQNNFSPKETVLSLDGKVKLILGVRASFIIYEIAGPSLGLEPYAETDVSTNSDPWWVLYAGIDGTYGIKTSWFSFGIIPEKNWTYSIVREEIARASTPSNKAPTAVINIIPTTGITTNTNISFSNSSSIDDKTPQSQLVGRWDWENDGSWDTQYSSLGITYHKYSNSGTYIAKLEVKDQEGLTGTTTKNILVSSVTPSPVFDNSKFSPADNSTNVDPDLTFSWSATSPSGNSLTYDLFLGSYSPSLSEIPNLTSNSYHLGNYFPSGTKVYWKVRAKDNQGNSTESSLMSFTVGSGNTGGPEYSTYTDPRDGHTYKTVKINGKWWFAENLDYGSPNSVYYSNSSSYKEYGRLYAWSEAKSSCPSGWHLPTKDEAQSLVDYTGGDLKEKGTTHWESPNTGANDKYGFSAFGGGAYNSSSGFFSLKRIGTFWTSTEIDFWSAYMLPLDYSTSEVVLFFYNKNNKCSVRPIKDN